MYSEYLNNISNQNLITMPLLNHVDSIPSAQISTIQHYPKSILIKMKDGTLYVTRQFSIGVNSIVGNFEREPYNNAVDSDRIQYVEPNDPGNKAYTLAKSAKLFGK